MLNQLTKKKLSLYYATTIFSILFAIIGFSYNAWRLEQSELNASVRVAAFSMLNTLSEFEQVVFANHYDSNLVSGSSRTGWAKVILMGDLAGLMSDEVEYSAEKLKLVWQENWSSLPNSNVSLRLIEIEIELLRQSIKAEIKQLN